MRRTNLGVLGLTALFAGVTAASGPEVCASCHPAESQKQMRSHHAQALHPIAESPLWAFFQTGPHPPGADDSLSYEARKIDVLVTASSGAAASLQWAFGAGVQGITPVGILDGRFIEHRFSYYSGPRRLALTFGHPERAAALGIPQDNRTIFQCFNCHSTGAKPGPDLTEMRPGITCDRCHGPGDAHISAVKAGASPAAIRRSLVNPGRFPAKAVIETCGECHRLPAPGSDTPEPEIEDPVSVRFAPVGLLASRCYQKSKQLTCLTCHDPHDNTLPRAAATYTDRCRSCHVQPPSAKSKCARTTNGDCLDCHMRQASLGPYLRFTDHRIRIY
jgi:hypothetical protein